MSKKVSKLTGTGSPQATSQTNQPQADRSDVRQQILVGLLTRRDVAKRWSCCEHTVARRTDLNPLRFNRRMLRYRIEDIVAIEAAAGNAGALS